MDEDRMAIGRRMREHVLGPPAGTPDPRSKLAAEFDALLLQQCWADIWSRPALDLRTRSLITLAILSMVGRPADLVLHTRGALRNGATPEEITEVLMQLSVYAGFPVALAALREVGPLLEDDDSANER